LESSLDLSVILDVLSMCTQVGHAIHFWCVYVRIDKREEEENNIKVENRIISLKSFELLLGNIAILVMFLSPRHIWSCCNNIKKHSSLMYTYWWIVTH